MGCIRPTFAPSRIDPIRNPPVSGPAQPGNPGRSKVIRFLDVRWQQPGPVQVPLQEGADQEGHEVEEEEGFDAPLVLE